MSILILGKSKCKLCGKIILPGDKYYQFPAFVVNSLDNLITFNDETCHISCLINNPNGKLAIDLAEKSLLSIKPINRICAIKKNLITDFNNDIYIGLLSSDSKQNSYPFNFIHLDKRNLKEWNLLSEFINIIDSMINSNKWKEIDGSNVLVNIRNQLYSGFS